jgi:hypothetical protein
VLVLFPDDPAAVISEPTMWGDECAASALRCMVELNKPPGLAARGGCWFRGGGLEVHLGVEKDFRPAAKAHPGILVRGLGDVAHHFAAHGVDVEWDGSFPGHHRFYAHDPLGNRLELLEPERPGAP